MAFRGDAPPKPLRTLAPSPLAVPTGGEGPPASPLGQLYSRVTLTLRF